MRNLPGHLGTIAGLLALSGCYAEQVSTEVEEVAGPQVAVAAPPTPAPAPSPSPVPTPTPTPAGSPVTVGPDASGIRQLASISSNFDPASMLAGTPVPDSADPDVVGAFRFTCKPSHLAYDDPIVFPNQKGRTHLHQFFGNTLADANSTYESLRTSGESTCVNELNRSAYWVPALMDGQGSVVLPEDITIYYKRRPASDPVCQTGKGCIAMPRGLRYVFGRQMDGVLRPKDHVHFRCNGGTSGAHFETLPEAAAVCPVGARIIAAVESPDCWDGINLDSPDHRSHMAYQISVQGQPACPDTHPYRMARLTMGVVYKVTDSLDRSGDLSTSRRTWYFSSDRMEGMTPQVSGTTFHADWYGAWDDDILKEWTDNCIDKKLNCSFGRLGSDRMMQAGDAVRRSTHGVTVAIPLRLTS